MQAFQESFRSYEPFIQIRFNSLIFYSLPLNASKYKRHELNYKTYSGKVTSGTQKRIRKAVDMLLQLSPPRLIQNEVTERFEMHTLSFITLTIPGNERHIEAREGNSNLLAPWLLRMKRKANLKTYIWKAEFQKNGQLHYHITTPSWIHYQLIKDEWNALLSKNKLLENWQTEHPGNFPNSTDVHKVYKIKNIAAYLQKYLSKNEQDKETHGKIWDCSMNIKKAKNLSFPHSQFYDYLTYHSQYKPLEHCAILNTKEPLKILPPKIQSEYKEHIKKIQAL